MQIMPAVDLREGKCVRLTKGKPGTEETYYNDPIDAAKYWWEQGATTIHIIDLDAALGLGDNIEIIKAIVKEVDAEFQVGGGISDIEKALTLHKLGVERVIIGTSAVKNPEMITMLKEKIGSKHIMVALDHVQGKVAIKGWRDVSTFTAFDLAKVIEDKGAGSILFTAVERDGMLTGPDIENTENMVRSVNIPVVAAGGIGKVKDVVELARTGVYGAVIGKAFYRNRFTYEEVLDALK
ncbi:1-(5-phosphoribosyl)-5-[(5-phosphoribosylamino)methylideneamino]imidazole-4-carboxamide isomerase [Candidatus Borrarchaeum sp.]|uniref:1-(5-phosphoribosyl)-5-[(5- phosphoribosylamino)methylideneamino]imidazole-4- carboxamide isomerase n=1 Tax=Candidatus Borrarchaeum sp. TaxID=2846742 RepID=UPI002579D83A|nr:1-(5-phosphoribosyl)-5-[(5-phosphoribosylamino)methylideneamino]imidazole-4-carboxamide isomerase [Candidatus Borrarchaeum sp.]